MQTSRYTRRWVAVDKPSLFDQCPPGLIAVELTVEDVAFLAELVNTYIEAWGDPEQDIKPIRKKLRGEVAGDEDR